MLPRNLTKWLVGLLIGIVLVVILSSFLLNRLSERPNISNTPRNFPADIMKGNNTKVTGVPTSGVVNANFTILYQQNGDTVGRTVIYDTKRDNYPNGIGLRHMADGFPYIVGIFNSWGNISTSDYLILRLVDPLNHQPIDYIKVVLLKGKEQIGEHQYISVISTENLSSIRDGSAHDGSQEEALPDLMGNYTHVSSDKLKNMILPGDALVVYPISMLSNDTWLITKDKDGMMIASTLLLRRWNGVRDI